MILCNNAHTKRGDQIITSPHDDYFQEEILCSNFEFLFFFINSIELRRFIGEEILCRDIQGLRKFTNCTNNRVFPVFFDIYNGLIGDTGKCGQFMLSQAFPSSPVFQACFHKFLHKTCCLSYIIHYHQTKVNTGFDKSVIVCYTNQSVIAIHLWEGEQIKTAGKIRQISTNDLVVLSSILEVLANRRKEPSNSLPFFSIANTFKQVKVLHKAVLRNMGSEREDLPMNTAKWYSVISTSTSLAGMDTRCSYRRNVLMPANTPKQSYEIIRHRRGLLVRIQGKYVPNRRGRPKHFPLVKHVQQYLQKVGAA